MYPGHFPELFLLPVLLVIVGVGFLVARAFRRVGSK